MTEVIAAQIMTNGLIAQLRADQPVALLLEMGDALLASPVLTVAISMRHPEADTILRAYAERYGNHLLVGAGNMTTVAEGITALSAGAQFLRTERYTTELHYHALRCGALYIPPAATSAALPALALMDVQMATLTAADYLAGPPTMKPPAILLSDVIPETLPRCAAAGASAVEIGHLLFPTVDWSMPSMIRTARRLRQLWEGRG